MTRPRRLLGSLRLAAMGAVIAALPLVGAIGTWASWARDNAVLRDKALAITAGLTSTPARIWAINNWAYHDQGFVKNNRYFVVPELGPTPIQIIQSGGDCSDKSRLVSAMLRQLGIDSGLVMIYPCRNCPPIHTVVEARDDGGRMVVDPIWDVDYPAGNGNFLGVRQLAGTKLGPEHIADLQRQSAPGAKIRKMPAAEATFDFTAAVNWNKNFATRALASALKALGYAPERLMRPQLLEDPKLALSLCLVAVAIGLVTLSALIGFAFPGVAERAGLPLVRRLEPLAFPVKRSVPARRTGGDSSEARN